MERSEQRKRNEEVRNWVAMRFCKKIVLVFVFEELSVLVDEITEAKKDIKKKAVFFYIQQPEAKREADIKTSAISRRSTIDQGKRIK